MLKLFIGYATSRATFDAFQVGYIVAVGSNALNNKASNPHPTLAIHSNFMVKAPDIFKINLLFTQVPRVQPCRRRGTGPPTRVCPVSGNPLDRPPRTVGPDVQERARHVLEAVG